MVVNSTITHHNETPEIDEEMSLTPENLVVLTWLRLIHNDLPSLVKPYWVRVQVQIESLLQEMCTSANVKILRTMASKLRPPSANAPYHTPQQPTTSGWS